MALTYVNGIQPTIIGAEYGVVLTLYPAFDVSTGLSSLDPVEVRRAPDNAGAPGTWETIAANLGPLPPRGQIFIDPRPNNGSVWWYAHRHTKAGGAIGGTWSASYKSVVQPIYPGDQRLDLPAANNATMANTSSRYRALLQNAGSPVLAGDGVYHALPFDQEAFDVGNLHDTVTNNSRITIPSVNYLGVWFFIGDVQFPVAGGAAYDASIAVAKNGTTFFPSIYQTVPAAGVAVRMAVPTYAVDPIPGDYFELMGLQTSGANKSILTTFRCVHLW